MDDISLRQLQAENLEWTKRNFPNNEPTWPLLGINEEAGELNHATLKMLQGIRGTQTQHKLDQIDAIGDMLIYIANFCNEWDIDLQAAINKTWEQVQQRDWQTNSLSGKV